MNPEAALTNLLQELFDGEPGELAKWVRLNLGKAIADGLPGSHVGLSELAFKTTLAVRAHGRADRDMFSLLCSARPHQIAHIKAVARHWGVVLSERPDKTIDDPPPLKLSRDERDRLVDLLIACSVMIDNSSRDVIVSRLDIILPRVQRHSGLKLDLTAIVDACAEHDYGIERLLKEARRFEGETRAMAAVNAFIASIARS